MKKIHVQGQVGRAEAEAAEVLVLLRCEGASGLTPEAAAIDAQLGGQLTRLFKRGEFEGKPGEGLLFHTQGKAKATRLLLVGLGKEKELRLDAFRQALGSAVKRVRQAKVTSYTVVMPDTIPHEMSALDVAQALVEGAILGNYQFTAYRSANGTKPIDVERLTLYTSQCAQLPQMTEGIRRGVATAEATVLVRDLCNHPSNVMTPTRIVREAKAVAKESGVRIKVLEQKDMEKLGMGALLGVARGSHEPPKFIILEYNGCQGQEDGTSGRARRQDHHIRYRRHLAQACREHGTYEGRYDGRSRSLSHDASGGAAQVAVASYQHFARRGKYAGWAGDETRRYCDDPVRKNR